MKLGDFVEYDGLPAVLVGLEGDVRYQVPEDHVALWFGEPQVERPSKGGPGGVSPLVYTVPIEYCDPGIKATAIH